MDLLVIAEERTREYAKGLTAEKKPILVSAWDFTKNVSIESM